MHRAYLPLFVFLLSTQGLKAEFGLLELYFAQVVIGAGTSTSFSIHNPTTEAIDVRVEIGGSDGAKVLEFDPLVEIPAGGTKKVSFAGGDQLVVGWAKLSSTGRFNATEFYQIVVGEVELPRVGVLPSPLVTKTKIFAFVIGRWLAYHEGAPGRTVQVWVTPFPAGEGRVLVSKEGGRHPPISISTPGSFRNCVRRCQLGGSLERLKRLVPTDN